jgi:hypothetical protein
VPELKLPIKATPLTAERVQHCLRVELRAKGVPPRIGLLTGLLDRSYRRPRVEIIPEGLALSRIETWAMADVILLPRKRQLRALGGEFDPPRGYPLVNKESGQIKRS